MISPRILSIGALVGAPLEFLSGLPRFEFLNSFPTTMAGPCVSLKLDPEYARLTGWKEGDIIEIKCQDDDGGTMGHALIVCEAKIRTRLFSCFMIAASDKDYTQWMSSDNGHDNPGNYRQAVGKQEDKELIYKKKDVLLVEEWRQLCRDNNLMDIGAIKWIPKNKIATYTQAISVRLQKVLANSREDSEPRGRSKVSPGRGKGTRSHEESEPQGRSKVSPTRDKGSRATLLPAKAHDKEGFQGELDDLRRSIERDPTGTRKVRSRSARGRGKEKRGRSITRKEGRDRPQDTGALSSQAPKPEQDRAPRQAGRSPRKRSDSPEEAQKKKRKKNRRGKSYSSSGSDSGSVFRNASTSKGRSSQARLMRWAARHPGRLMAQALQRMEDRVGRDGEAKEWDSMALPAAAKSYFLRVLRAENGSRRNLRELQTLCACLDHIAQGRHLQAGDFLMQRLKALELAMHTGNWERASFLELIETEGAPLVGKEEEFMTAKESEFQKRIHKADPQVTGNWPALYPNGNTGWPQSGKGAPWVHKGKGKDGKDKGKGKAKGKGKKDNPNKGAGGNSWDWQGSW